MKKSRREFVQSGSVLATSAAVAAAFPSGVHSQDESSEELQIALVGCGGRGTGAAAQALAAGDKHKLTAMADIDAEALQRSREILDKGSRADSDDDTSKVDVPAERQFIGLDAYRKVMELDDVDVVILTTPPGFRPFQFEAAIQSGKHVFMEKPVAVDAPGVRKVLEFGKLADDKGLKVGVGLNRRHSTMHQTAIGKIHEGIIGDLPHIQIFNCRSDVNKRQQRQPGWSELEFQIRNWYYFTWLAGDFNVEQSVHEFDVVRWIKKEANPVSCQGQGGRIVRKGPMNGQIYDHFSADFQFADGSMVSTQHRHIPGCWSWFGEKIHGTKGYAELASKQRGMIRLHGEENPVWREIDRSNSYQLEHDALFDAIRNNTPHNEAERGAYSTLFAMMDRMAAYTGKEITWEQALQSEEQLAFDFQSFEEDAPFGPNPDMTYDEALPGRRI